MTTQIIFYLLIVGLLALPMLVIKSKEGKIKLKVGLVWYALLFWIMFVVITILYGSMQLAALQEIGSPEYMAQLLEKHTEEPVNLVDGYLYWVLIWYFLSTTYILGWLYGLMYYIVSKPLFVLINSLLTKKDSSSDVK